MPVENIVPLLYYKTTMNFKHFKSLRSLKINEWIFICGISVVILLNSKKLFKELNFIQQYKKHVPFQFVGFKFSGLDDILKNEEIIGYITDKDLKDENHAKQFAQAQYILVPTILDINNLDHRFLLFDCSSEEVALKKINETKALPLRKNQFGIILAIRP